MQEKHPIDERFRALLHDAEATPPDRVHAALAQRMGWRARSTGAGTLPFLLVGFAGVALALANWTSSGTQTQRVGAVHAPGGPEMTTGNSPSAPAAGAIAPSTPTGTTEPAAAITQHTPGAEVIPVRDTETSTIDTHYKAPTQPGTTSVAAGTDAGPSGTRASSTRTATVQAAPPDMEQATAHHTQAATVASPDATPWENGTAHAVHAPTPKATTDAGSALPATAAHRTTMETSALERLSPIVRFGEAAPGMPEQAAMPAPYVLPRGEWWWSIGAGVSRTSATWSGDGAEAMARAEQWRSGHHLNVGLGRSWRSGLGAGMGLHVERLRSDFGHEAHVPGEPHTGVDTSWTTVSYPGWNTPVSIWSIDTTTVVGPGSWERTSARNSYTVLQLPVTVWWHADVRRWSFGATAGVMGWMTVQRAGQTLARSSSDGSWNATALDDPALGDRFRPQLHGIAGLSVGYLLSEHLRVLAEPMYSAPLYVGPGSPSVALTRTLFQIRLQHALHCR